jgi:signal transduction histidine kinase
MASHDLKAPLRGLSNLSTWIEEGVGAAAGDEVNGYLAMMRTRVAQMVALIDGMLKYARAGESDAREDVPMVGLLAEIVELLQPVPTCTIEIAPDLPVLHVEKVPLQQVLLNLVSNALKYARRDDVHVSVGGRWEGGAYHFTVGDNGPGIPADSQERIWEIFQTLEPRAKGEGTGIGLAVVKKIVESRGGRAWVESEEGKGSVFHVLWPC